MLNNWITRLVVGLCVAVMLSGCFFGRIETGHVGVRTEWNKTVQLQEVPQGFYTAIFSSVDEHVTKETELYLSDMQPKAKDNLTMAKLDVSVFYTINPAMVADTFVKYANMTVYDRGLNYPGYLLVKRMATRATFNIVAQHESLTLHTMRPIIEDKIMQKIQNDLDINDPNVFTITKVVIQNALTDPELEKTIRESVQMEKLAEKKRNEIQVAEAEAERLLVEAQGQAAAIKEVSEALTDQYVTFKQIEIMAGFAPAGRQGDTHTIVLPTQMAGQTLLPLGK